MAVDAVLAYATAVTGEVMTASGGSLHAAYLHGSAVLGGWQVTSDVDMLLVAGDALAGFLTDDAIVSKIAGGEAALDRGFGSAELIMRALSQQRGQAARQQPGDDAAEFVRATASALRDVCGINYRP